ncbi:MAG: hypothetical protein COA69_01015 [Robiginitomaculum sp.]|nr:MAG: hypothetical protein COA69_01015 [Robiginitomaculum sp.]
MKPLNAKYTQILWMNVVLLSGGVGYLVYKKFDGNILYGAGAALVIGGLEYVVMGASLRRKQHKEDEVAK